MKTDDVIMHQQIMHTWASFALEHDLDFYNEKHMESMVEWTEEAIEALKEHGTQVQYLDDHIAEYEKEIKRLNKLLKEQEAEKPIAKEDDTFECCTCGAIVGWEELNASGIVQTRFNYCPFCGKKVKWE